VARVTAISSLGWAHYTLYEALPRMAAMGFRRIEIASFFSYCFHFNSGSPRPRELRRMLDELRLVPVCLNYCGGFYEARRPEDARRYVDDMRRKIEQLPEVGIPMMTMQGFGMRGTGGDWKRPLTNCLRVWNRLGKIGAKHGVKMLLEVPHLYHTYSDAERALWIFERLESPNVGALVDTTHWHATGYDAAEFFSLLGDRLWHVHLRDARANSRSRDGTGYDLELTPGRGDVDFRGFAAALDVVGYDADVSLEFEYRDMDLDSIEKEFGRGMRYLRRCGWELPVAVDPAAHRGSTRSKIEFRRR